MPRIQSTARIPVEAAAGLENLKKNYR